MTMGKAGMVGWEGGRGDFNILYQLSLHLRSFPTIQSFKSTTHLDNHKICVANVNIFFLCGGGGGGRGFRICQALVSQSLIDYFLNVYVRV